MIFRRLPEAASTCSDESLSARTVPALSWPSSSKKTCMGKTQRGAAPGSSASAANYSRARSRAAAALRAAPALLHSRRLATTQRELNDHGDRIPAAGRQRPRGLAALPRHDDVRRPHRRRRRAADRRRRVRRRRQLHRHRRRLRQRRVGEDRRRGDQGQPAALDPRDQGRQRDDRRSRTTAGCRGAGCCRPATTAWRASRTDYIDIYYLHKDDPRHADRRDGRRDRRPDPRAARSATSASRTIAAGASPKSSANARRRACRCRSSASRTTTC